MLKQFGKSYNDYTLSFQRGEEEGFDFFFRILFPQLCFFANRKLNNMEEAEDIVSAALLKFGISILNLTMQEVLGLTCTKLSKMIV